MRFIILLVLVSLQICTSSVLFRIRSNDETVPINSSYLFGTTHVAQNLIWPYLSNETIRILTEMDEIWMEHDFTDPQISKHIYGCAIDKMSFKQQDRIRTKTWSQFLNETKRKSLKTKILSQDLLEQWRHWLVNNQFTSNKYLWRNQTVTNDTIFDHRIMLEGYQRGIYVGSLESIPNDCFQMENSRTSNESSKPMGSIYQKMFSRVYNCDMIDEDFIKEAFTNLDLIIMKKRNEQMTKQIHKLLKNDPHKNYLFAVGAAHLFGKISIVQMLQNRYNDHYHIEQIVAPSPSFPYQLCTDEEFDRLMNEINPVQNKTIGKRFINVELFDRISASLFD